ncbi:putative Mechanosensitive ion channel [Leishmania shawi]
MIYDTNSAQYQQFLRSSGRRRDDYGKSKTAIVNKQTAKPAGAASTGLMKRFFNSLYEGTGIITDAGQRSIASRVSALAVEGVLAFTVLGTLGVDTAPLIAAAGVTGATIGFACKDFGANFVASIALSGQRALRTGNKVSIGVGPTMVSGTVVDWDTRYIYLQNEKKAVLCVPNNVILNSVVTWEPPNSSAPLTAESAAPAKDNREWSAAAGAAGPPKK